MRIQYYIVVLLLCALVLPAFAADDTPEAMNNRVKQLENANLALKEELGRTQLALDTTKTNLKKALDDEAKARKELNDTLTASLKAQADMKAMLDDMQKKLAGLSDKSATDNQANASNISALNTKVAALEKALNDQAAAHAKDIADLRTGFTTALDKQRDDFGKEMASFKDLVETKFAAMRKDLDAERDERIAADQSADKVRAQLAKQQKKDRTFTYIMGAVLGGLTLGK